MPFEDSRDVSIFPEFSPRLRLASGALPIFLLRLCPMGQMGLFRLSGNVVTLLENCDAALYGAKAAGRNQVGTYRDGEIELHPNHGGT